MRKDDRLEDNSDRDLLVVIFISMVIFLVIAISYLRRKSIAPRVCPVLCSALKSERYDVWEDSDWGIRCICKGKIRTKKPPQTLIQP